MVLTRKSWSSAQARRWRFVAIVILLLVASVAILELWATPPPLLTGPRALTVAALGWVHTHVLTVTVAGLLVSMAGLGMPLLLRKLERRDAFLQQHRTHERQVMLARVRHRWITGVLDPSLTDQVRIRLRMHRRPDAVRPPDMMIRRAGARTVAVPADMSISAIFNELGGGLLILGAPGSGKTTAILQLARDLIEDAEADQTQPIPIVFSLSSWAARRPTLDDWLINELHTRYFIPRQIGARWLAGNELLPLFDGLDEVAPSDRNGCIEAINQFLRDHGLVRIVVCSRTQEYATLPSVLELEEAVELEPLTRQQVSDYLAASGAPLADVRAALAADPTLWDLLCSPLVLAIAAVAYQDRPANALRIAGTPTQRLALLFEAYTRRMFERRSGRYTFTQTQHWLGWLAGSMWVRNESEFHLDRLQPDWLPSAALQRLATLSPAVSVGLVFGLVVALVLSVAEGLVWGLFFILVFGLKKADYPEASSSWPRIHGALRAGLVVGLVLGLEDLPDGLDEGLAQGLFFGLVGGLLFAFRKTEPVEEVNWSWWRARVGLVVGLAGGLICGLTYGLTSPTVELAQGLLLGLSFGAAVGLIHGLVPGLVDKRTFPNEGIYRSARRALAIGPFFGLFFALPFWLYFGLTDALLAELFFGVAGGLLFGGLACLQHFAVRVLLTLRGFAPLRYISFLDDATERLLLRRAGGGYIFIHRLLLEYFAVSSARSGLGQLGRTDDWVLDVK